MAVLNDLEELNQRKCCAPSLVENIFNFLIASQRHHLIVPLIQAAISAELESCSTLSTLCRGNTIQVKILSSIPRRFGQSFLKSVLVPFIASVIEEDYDYDTDTCSADDKPVRIQRVQQVMSQFMDSIRAALPSVHPVIRITAAILSDAVRAKFEDEGVLVALSGFFVLRFLCPILMQPLVAQPPVLNEAQQAALKSAKHANSTLKLFSRLLQSIANRSLLKVESMKDYSQWFEAEFEKVPGLLLELPLAASAVPLESFNDESLDLETTLRNLDNDFVPDKKAFAPLQSKPDSAEQVLSHLPCPVAAKDLLSHFSSTNSTATVAEAGRLYALLVSQDKAFDYLVEGNADNIKALCDALVYLGVHAAAPQAFNRCMELVLEGEVLLGAPFEGSLLQHFLCACFRVLLDGHWRELFQQPLEALITAGRAALIDLARLTPSEVTGLASHVDNLSRIANAFLDQFLVALNQAPIQLWQTLHFLFVFLPSQHPNFKPNCAHMLVDVFVMLVFRELPLTDITAKPSTPTLQLCLANLADLLRVTAGAFIKLEPKVFAVPSCQELITRKGQAFSDAVLAYCRNQPSVANTPRHLAPSDPKITQQTQSFQIVLRRCPNLPTYFPTDSISCLPSVTRHQMLQCLVTKNPK